MFQKFPSERHLSRLVQCSQNCACLNGIAYSHIDAGNCSVLGCHDGDLHFHSLNDDNRVTTLYSLTYICLDLEYFSGCSCFHLDRTSACRGCFRCGGCRRCLRCRCCCFRCRCRCGSCSCCFLLNRYIVYISIYCDCVVFPFYILLIRLYLHPFL